MFATFVVASECMGSSASEARRDNVNFLTTFILRSLSKMRAYIASGAENQRRGTIPRALKVQNVTSIAESGRVFPFPHGGKNAIRRIFDQPALFLKSLSNGRAIPSQEGVVPQLGTDP